MQKFFWWGWGKQVILFGRSAIGGFKEVATLATIRERRQNNARDSFWERYWGHTGQSFYDMSQKSS